MSDNVKSILILIPFVGLLLLLLTLAACSAETHEEYNAPMALVHKYKMGSTITEELYRIRRQLELMNRQQAEKEYECTRAEVDFADE